MKRHLTITVIAVALVALLGSLWLVPAPRVDAAPNAVLTPTGTGNFEDQSTIVSANAADAHGGQQYALVGQWNCVFADVTNSNALGLKVIGVAKP